MPNKLDGLDQEQIAATRLPLLEASTLSPQAYVSEAWYAREVERIFLREWLCVGRAEQVPNVGDYFRVDVVGEPIVVVRDKNGTVRAHSAVCRHRGTVIVSGEGNCRAFQCPYHGWTYALSGELRATPGPRPPMVQTKAFDRADYGLVPVRLETWEGFLFVTFDPATEPLRAWLGELPGVVAEYRMGDLVLTRRHRWTISANWKILLEGMEDYHLPFLHQKWVNAEEARMESERIVGPGRFDALCLYQDGEARDSQIIVDNAFANIEGVSRPGAVIFISVYPNFQLGITGKYVLYRTLLPEGPERVCVTEDWLFPKATVAHPDFESSVDAEFIRPIDQVFDEDLEIAANVQHGMRARLARPGRYSYKEGVVHALANYVLDRALGAPADGGAHR